MVKGKIENNYFKGENYIHSLRVMYEDPPEESLNLIKQGELGVFCEGNKLYCKVHNKEKMQVKREESSVQGMDSKSFDSLMATLKDGKKQHYLKNIKTLEEEDAETQLLQFTSLCSYTPGNSLLKVSFPCGGIRDLFQKFLYLRDIFSLPNNKITHMGLLEKLEYFLYKRYEPVLERASVYERFKIVEGPFYFENTNGAFTTKTRSHHIIQSQYIQDKKALWNWLSGYDTDDPTKALKTLDIIKEAKESEALASLFKRFFSTNRLPKSALNRQELYAEFDFSKVNDPIPLSEQQAFLTDLSNNQITS